MSYQLWSTLLKWRISPNQAYFLDCCREGIIPSKILINPDAERLIAQAHGYIDESGKLTNKATPILEEFETFLAKTKKSVTKATLGEDFAEKVNEYREIFPKGKLPSGELARQSVKELQDKFVWFFKTFPEYDWDVILDATEYYVATFAKKNYMYMVTSSYFIKKTLPTKESRSKLADYCQEILDNPDLLL